jgi:hypothetical protein
LGLRDASMAPRCKVPVYRRKKEEAHSLGIGFTEKECDGSIMRWDVNFWHELIYTSLVNQNTKLLLKDAKNLTNWAQEKKKEDSFFFFLSSKMLGLYAVMKDLYFSLLITL